MSFFESIAPAIIGGGSGIAGGIIGNLINQNQQENEATRNQSNFNITTELGQKNFENTLQIRAKDAKAAGFHPLYGVGGGTSIPGGASSQPIIMQDSLGGSINQAGQNIASAMSRMQSPEEKLMVNLDLKLRESQIAETDARTQMLQSEAARLAQAGQYGMGPRPEGTGLISPEGQAPNPPGTGIIDLKPSPQISSKEGRPDTVAGLGETNELRWLLPNFPMYVPRLEGESLEEIFSEMSMGRLAGIIQYNTNVFGPEWAEDFIAYRYGGVTPKRKYNVQDYKKLKQNYNPVEHIGVRTKKAIDSWWDKNITPFIEKERRNEIR